MSHIMICDCPFAHFCEVGDTVELTTLYLENEEGFDWEQLGTGVSQWPGISLRQLPEWQHENEMCV